MWSYLTGSSSPTSSSSTTATTTTRGGKSSPINGVPVIPNGTWYAGHLYLMRGDTKPNQYKGSSSSSNSNDGDIDDDDCEHQQGKAKEDDFRNEQTDGSSDFERSLYRFSVEYADEYGRCTFYMGPTTPSLSVTSIDDVQTLLRASSHREIFPLMVHHVEQLFGKYNIGVLTGNEWKSKRKVIVQALHGTSFLQHNQHATQVATANLISRLNEEIRVTKQEQGCVLEDSSNRLSHDDDANNMMSIESTIDGFFPIKDTLRMMKCLALDVFGQAALHEDFGCCNGEDFWLDAPVGSSSGTQKEVRDDEGMNRADHNDEKTATVTTTMDTTSNRIIAKHFEFMAKEMMRRLTIDIFNPASHLYSLPTTANRMYTKANTDIQEYISTLIQQRKQQISSPSTTTTHNDVPNDLLTNLIRHNLQEGERRKVHDGEMKDGKDNNDMNVNDHHNRNEDTKMAKMLSDTLKSLLFAGYETTSVTMTYVLYLLAKYPSVQQTCVEEILFVTKQQQDEVEERGTTDTVEIEGMSTSSSSSTTATTSTSRTTKTRQQLYSSNYDNFPYLQAVIQETLRLYPPAISTTRSLERSIDLKKKTNKNNNNNNYKVTHNMNDEQTNKEETIHIPKGIYLYFPIWVIQRDAKNFPRPSEFLPERWVKKKKNTGNIPTMDGDGTSIEVVEWEPRNYAKEKEQEGEEKKRQQQHGIIENNSDTFIPCGNPSGMVAFSAGARSCAGERFARQELIMCLSTLLRQYEFRLRSDTYKLQVHREGVVQSPKGIVPIVLRPRTVLSKEDK